jgi:hypothetical protein
MVARRSCLRSRRLPGGLADYRCRFMTPLLAIGGAKLWAAVQSGDASDAAVLFIVLAHRNCLSGDWSRASPTVHSLYAIGRLLHLHAANPCGTSVLRIPRRGHWRLVRSPWHGYRSRDRNCLIPCPFARRASSEMMIGTSLHRLSASLIAKNVCDRQAV